MLMLRSTHQKIIDEKNLAAIKFVEWSSRVIDDQKLRIQVLEKELESLKKGAKL